MMHILFASQASTLNIVFVSQYLFSSAEFGLWLALVTMTIEVALGGGRRVCFRPRQTEK